MTCMYMYGIYIIMFGFLSGHPKPLMHRNVVTTIHKVMYITIIMIMSQCPLVSDMVMCRLHVYITMFCWYKSVFMDYINYIGHNMTKHTLMYVVQSG